MSLALETTATTPTTTTASPRLPSPRPIDHRWDRSRGILFSDTKRPSSANRTWSHANGIAFASMSTTAKSYARSPMPSPSSLRSSQASKNATGDGFSLVELEKYRNQAKDLADEVAGKKEEIRDLERKQQSMARENHNLKTSYADLQRKAEQDVRKAREDASKAPKAEYEKQTQKLEDDYQRRNKGRDVEYEQKVKELERLFKEQLERNPEYTTIVQDMRKKEVERDADRLREQEQRSKEQAERLAEQDEHRRSQEAMEKQRIELAEKREEADEVKKHNLELLDERAHRSNTDRKDYHVYRTLFSEITDSVISVLEQMSKAMRELDSEAEKWRKDELRFQDWKKKEYKFFDQLPQYKPLSKAVSDFLLNRASQAESASQQIDQLRVWLRGEMREAKSLSHVSRSLTRVLRFDEEQTVYETIKLSHQLVSTDFYVYKIKQYKDGMDESQEKMNKSQNPDTNAQLLQDYLKCKERRHLFMTLAAVTDHLNEIRALGALLDDSTVEKMVFLETHEAAQNLRVVLDGYRDIRHKVESGWNERRQRQIKSFNVASQEARSLIDENESLVRRRCIIQLETGALDEGEERRKADDLITRRIEEEQKSLESDLIELIPALKKTPATRRERVASERAQAPVTVDSLRRSLARKVPTLTPRPAASPRFSSLIREKLATYGLEISKLEGKKAELVASVDGNIDKLKDKSKTTLQDIEANLSGVRRGISRLKAEGKATAAKKPASAPSDLESSASVAAETDTTSGELPRVKRSSNRMQKRLDLRARRRSSSKASATSEKESDETGPYPGSKSLNLSPSKPMQACHSRMPSEDIERRMSWIDLSDEAKTRAPNALDIAHANDEEAGQVDIRPAHDSPGNTSPPLSLANSSNADDFLASQHTASAGTEQELESTDAEAESESIESEPDMVLTYQIPAQDYRAAVMASSNSSAAYWSHKLYMNPEGKKPLVYYCQNFESAEKQAKEFLNEPVLGFDLEWEPKSSLARGTIKRNVSLIQIAAEDRIGLFQIALFKGETADELMPPSLRKILESPDVIKTGVNISGDSRRMLQCLNVDMKGVMELSHLYRVVKFSVEQPKLVSFKLVSLADQVQNVLLLPLRKDENRVSSWSRVLNTQQTDYAAADAYAGFRIYHKLEEMRKEMKPTPPRPAFFETMQPIVLGDGTVVERSAKRAPGVAASKKTTAEAEEGEEEDEFFDAQEELDTCELASADPSASASASAPASGVPQSDAPAIEPDQIAYPTLPQVSEDSPNASNAEPANQERSPPTASQPLPTAPEPARATTNTQRPFTLETMAADTWIASRRSSSSNARPSELRAYHLWHIQDLSLQTVASTLRDPPLALTTVASYVLQAVREESLPYDVERVKEPLEILPKSVHGRYKAIVEKVKKAERGRGREV